MRVQTLVIDATCLSVPLLVPAADCRMTLLQYLFTFLVLEPGSCPTPPGSSAGRSTLPVQDVFGLLMVQVYGLSSFAAAKALCK